MAGVGRVHAGQTEQKGSRIHTMHSSDSTEDDLTNRELGERIGDSIRNGGSDGAGLDWLTPVLVGVIPAAVVGIIVMGMAVNQGWDWRRAAKVAAGTLLLPVAALLSGVSPVRAYENAVTAAREGSYVVAALDAVAITAPAGTWLAVLGLTVSTYRAQTGQMRTLHGGERIMHQRSQARARLAAKQVKRPQPLTVGHGDNIGIVLGPLTEEIKGGVMDPLKNNVPRSHLVIPYSATRQGMLIIAQPGAGKTETLKKISMGVFEAGWRLRRKKKCGRPLVIMIDCKGGVEAEDDANDWADALYSLGAHPDRVGIWPHADRLDIWQMPAKDMAECLHGLAATDNQYYSQLQRTLLSLICEAPEGPPKNSAQFMARLNRAWLERVWSGRPEAVQVLEMFTEGRDNVLGSQTALFWNLFRDLGRDLDSGRSLDDFDALYCAIPSVRRPAEAVARSSALLALIKDLATQKAKGREITVLFDEYSAVGGKADLLGPILERFRSQGVGTIAGGQTVYGMATSQDEFRRLAGAAGGGYLLMRSPDPEILADLVGTRRVLEASRHQSSFAGALDEGSGRMQDERLVDPNRIRSLPTGHICYGVSNYAQYGVVARVPKKVRRAKEVTAQYAAIEGPRISVVELETMLTEQQRALTAGGTK